MPPERTAAATGQTPKMEAAARLFKLADAAEPLDLMRLAAEDKADRARLDAMRRLISLMGDLSTPELDRLVARALEMKVERLQIRAEDADRRELVAFDRLPTVAMAEAAASMARAIAARGSDRADDAATADARRSAAFWLGRMSASERGAWIVAVGALRDIADDMVWRR